jgi:hypothetical protein
VGLVFLSTSRVVELMFPRLDPMVADLPLAFLGYGGLLFAFLCYFFRFGKIVHLKMSFMGEWPNQRVVDRVFLAGFFTFFFDFGSQIKTSPSTSD